MSIKISYKVVSLGALLDGLMAILAFSIVEDQ